MNKKNWYVVEIDAKVSDTIMVRASSTNEAKRLAVQKFAKVGNFNLHSEKCKTIDEAREAKRWGL